MSAAGDGKGVTRGPADLDTILLATDLGPASTAATEQATELAVRLGARLLVVHVLGLMQGMVPLSRSRGIGEREARTIAAQRVVEKARSSGADAAFLLWEGDAADGILAAAEAEAADVIVVGTHARTGVGRYLLGSVSDQIVHRASCPVLVVKSRPEDGR
jgi:nucleotide-binding universal stress UspA family protein